MLQYQEDKSKNKSIQYTNQTRETLTIPVFLFFYKKKFHWINRIIFPSKTAKTQAQPNRCRKILSSSGSQFQFPQRIREKQAQQRQRVAAVVAAAAAAASGWEHYEPETGMESGKRERWRENQGGELESEQVIYPYRAAPDI